MNCCLAKDRKEVLLPGNHMAKRLYQLRARFQDGLKVCRAQFRAQRFEKGESIEQLLLPEETIYDCSSSSLSSACGPFSCIFRSTSLRSSTLSQTSRLT
jgi:hypothetical protein